MFNSITDLISNSTELEGWRNITDNERKLLKEWHINELGFNEENAEINISKAEEKNGLIVKDKYKSGSPGYVGPMIIKLGGQADLYRVFGVIDDEVVEFEQIS